MIFNEDIKKVINNHTKKEAAKILGCSIRRIDHFVFYYSLDYVKAYRTGYGDKTLGIIKDLHSGTMNQNAIAKKWNVSRQYVSFLKKMEEKK